MRGIASVLLLLLHQVHPWRQERTWDDRHWCEQVVEPYWPLAYEKAAGVQAFPNYVEEKGRIASNYQHMGHECNLRGARTKCHLCEDIECGPALDGTCEYQIQGVIYSELPRNVPTVSDTPFAVGPNVLYRYDFGNAERVCVITAGLECIRHDAPGNAYQHCPVRCWGVGAGVPVEYEEGWMYDPFDRPSQGYVYTFVGGGQALTTDSLPREVPATYEVLGQGESGFVDGVGIDARFNTPTDMTIAPDGNMYVVDSGNHAIRKVAPNGDVTTLVGGGVPGYKDGPIADALFSHPRGIDMYEDCDNYSPCELVLIVADTGNHRIRKIVQGEVFTIAGGGGLSPDEMELEPHGYLDEWGPYARFDSPHGVAVDASGNIFVADTKNHLIRVIDGATGIVHTLAGSVIPSPMELPGCIPPCLTGEAGFEDGPILSATFTFPVGIAIGPGDPYTLLVTDGDRVRQIGRAGTPTFTDAPNTGGGGFARQATLADILTLDQVWTLAGDHVPGQADGPGYDATFETPRGIVMTGDGKVYVGDSSRCRIRELSVAEAASGKITCETRLVDIFTPSGCGAYEPSVDAVGHLVSPVVGFTYYRYDQTIVTDTATIEVGRILPQCVGSPPPDTGWTTTGQTKGPYLGTIHGQLHESEDTSDGSMMLLSCPSSCLASGTVYGTGQYGELSTICAAAIHAGAVTDTDGGVVLVRVRRGRGNRALAGETPDRTNPLLGTSANGVTSLPLSRADRTFTVVAHPQPDFGMHVRTIAGGPAAGLGNSCGFVDGGPPKFAFFGGINGLAVYPGTQEITMTDHLYILDTQNHAIRAMTAACDAPCHNGGECTGTGICTCAPGWKGYDCTTPVCSSPCGPRELCTAPDTCTCVPGYTGANCDKPMCALECLNGGFCSAPDTCSCPFGWFDPTCNTPVCVQTCGNGGKCVAPDKCRCPSNWKGTDCRTPVCTQTCLNGGKCIAPDTCLCGPGWSGHDCSKPVCHQGFFRADPYPDGFSDSLWREPTWDQFMPCDYDEWCEATDEFQCYQKQITVTPTEYPVDQWKTGKIEPQDVCFPIEIATNITLPYRVETELGTLTPYMRRTPYTPYDWGPTSTTNPWSSPSASALDRQVAWVTWATVSQGVYVCANGGSCVGPDTCRCADGWTGFDCRTPVCPQGYFYPVPGMDRYSEYGKYRVSERTLTIWESPVTPNKKFEKYIHHHPNFHSIAYDMDPANGFMVTHVYLPGPATGAPPEYPLQEGWRLNGVWNRTANAVWLTGNALTTYERECHTPSKAVDLRDMSTGLPVDSTDAAYRPRIIATPAEILAQGRWVEEGGECIDRALLGCYNGGACIAPGVCECAPGWEGTDCSIPICTQSVEDVFWSNLLGTRWETDGRNPPTRLILEEEWDTIQAERNAFLEQSVWDPEYAVRYLESFKLRPPAPPTPPPTNDDDPSDDDDFGDDDGSAVDPEEPEPPSPPDWLVYRKCPNNGNCTRPDTCTCARGWTGPDCTTPICAQECMNGGVCTAPDTCTCKQWPSTFVDGRKIPRYKKPDQDIQDTGWTGYDCSTPICTQAIAWLPIHNRHATDPTDTVPLTELLVNSPDPQRNDGGTFQAGCDPGTTYTPAGAVRKNAALCNQHEWWQGSYEDEWMLKVDTPTSSPTKKHSGRVVRINYPNYQPSAEDPEVWEQGDPVHGEGMYICHNNGMCTAPETCTCPWGWTGFDCNVPICEFEDVYGNIVEGCKNNGICSAPNHCRCARTSSLLQDEFPKDDLPLYDTTGFVGSDCSIPTCTQGWFDPDCSDLLSSPYADIALLGEGCYRCHNGGVCTSPDTCTCPYGWEGFGCERPVCTLFATQALETELATLDPAVVSAFELDPCGSALGRGNCTDSGYCSCQCYSRSLKGPKGSIKNAPWKDIFNRKLPRGFIHGRFDCADGWEGEVAPNGRFLSCHLRIYVPTWWERYTLPIICVCLAIVIFVAVAVFYLRRILRRRYLAARMRRRRLRRKKEQEATGEAGLDVDDSDTDSEVTTTYNTVDHYRNSVLTDQFRTSTTNTNIYANSQAYTGETNATSASSTLRKRNL